MNGAKLKSDRMRGTVDIEAKGSANTGSLSKHVDKSYEKAVRKSRNSIKG